ncbi:hypothetical protein M2349_000801 [Caldanaerobacter subterraneus subsp. tengcongensis MB4]|nr:hypothetical protein [Caldanaerobacter subterraneus subsp. tengcongensis MB4]
MYIINHIIKVQKIAYIAIGGGWIIILNVVFLRKSGEKV